MQVIWTEIQTETVADGIASVVKELQNIDRFSERMAAQLALQSVMAVG